MTVSPLPLSFRREWPHVILAARGTLAALLALAAAVALGLECPFWAAMTALIVIQPTRGLLLEKSYFRLVGTAFGTAAGLLMLLATRSPRSSRCLVNARKLDDDPGAIVEGGLAALVIGRRIQSLRETERREEGAIPSSWALRETALKLAAALLRPDAILAVLEDVSMQLCGSMATAGDSLQFPAPERNFAGGKVRTCPT